MLGGPVISSLNLRLFFPQKIPLLLVTAGLELLLRYGDFACNPLSRASLNQVYCAPRFTGPILSTSDFHNRSRSPELPLNVLEHMLRPRR